MARRPSEDEIELGLVQLATYGSREASRRTGIAETTLRGWAKRHPYRYAEIRETEAAKWRARAAADSEDLADKHRQLAEKTLEKAEQALAAGDLTPKDYAGLIKSLNLGAGIHTDKSSALRDRPTQVVEHKHSVEQIDRALSHLLQEADTVESTAVEVEPQLPPIAEQG